MLALSSKALGVPSSVYSPSSIRMASPPTLPQSALLNSLPLKDDLVGEIQAYLESFIELIEPTADVTEALGRNSSLLWTQLRRNAQRALEICEQKRSQLLPVFNADETSMLQIQRAEFGERYLYDLTSSTRRLFTAALEANSTECAVQFINALTGLVFVADGLVRGNATLQDVGPTDDEYLSITRLIGRARVNLMFDRRGEDGNLVPLGNISLIVDGYNYPVTAGNFVDLCKRRFYDGLPLQFRPFESRTAPVTRVVCGLYPTGFTDPFTGKQRTVPLEILRQDDNGERYSLYGAARNTAVFTKARPLLSFRTAGAVGMLHPDEDGNGGSAAFFWLKDTPGSGNSTATDSDEYGLGPKQSRFSALVGSTSSFISKLDNRFAIFGFMVSGWDLAQQLQAGDVLAKVKVEEGVWQLLKLKTPTFTEILFRGDSEDAETSEPPEGTAADTQP